MREAVIKKAEKPNSSCGHSRAEGEPVFSTAKQSTILLFCRYSPKFGNLEGPITNQLICPICIFQKFFPSVSYRGLCLFTVPSSFTNV